MTDTTDLLRITIEQTLLEADGLCLDDADDRMILTGLLLGRIRPALVLLAPPAPPADPTDTGARLEYEYHWSVTSEAQS